MIGFINGDTQKLSATAYILSQADMLVDLEAAFTFGPFRTYQVPIANIEKMTGLSFGNLRRYDPLRPSARRAAGEEGRAAAAARVDGGMLPLNSLADIVLY